MIAAPARAEQQLAKEEYGLAKKLRVGVIFGGKSGEHDVSVMSATSMLKALREGPYELIPIGVDRSGRFRFGKDSLEMLPTDLAGSLATGAALKAAGSVEQEEVSPMEARAVAAVRGPEGFTAAGELSTWVDIVIPALHGPFGEDGSMQGLLDISGVPYVGSGVLASAVGMDKIMTKQVLETYGLPQAPYRWFTRSAWRERPQEVLEAVEELGYPCFVKPANMGSSVGITRATDRDALKAGLDLATEYDRRVLVEKGLTMRELEVGVLGWDEPRASVVGEVIPTHDFYDYEAKYFDDSTTLVIPAELEAQTAERLRDLAVRTFRALDCSGLARVDFFLERETDAIYVNELNTMPGFTPYSMYPQLWLHSGMGYADLLAELIRIGLARHADRARNRV